MQQRIFGQLGDISALTLGGGGIGQVWGPTTRDEAMATVRAAWEAGITWFDVAPSYGRGEAEVVLGEAFGGRLPPGVRVWKRNRFMCYSAMAERRSFVSGHSKEGTCWDTSHKLH
jgi:predicted aldo/keto reductase-like oxidoreductase